MSIYEQVKKKDLIAAIKGEIPNKDFIKVVVGEFDRVGKDLSDYQCIPILKKMKKNAEENNTQEEIKYLDTLIPTQMSVEQIEEEVKVLISEGANNIGAIMQGFNNRFKGLADNSIVSKKARELL